MIYSLVPVRQAKEKEIPATVRALSLREARAKLDDMFEGAATGRKLQTVLLGKRLLKHEGWYPLLDVLYRDTKNTITADVVYVNDPVSQVIYAKFPEIRSSFLSLVRYDQNIERETRDGEDDVTRTAQANV